MAEGPDRILDAYLAASARAGSREAFDLLVRRWTPRLTRYLVRRTGSVDMARDVLQETWVSVVGAVRRLDDPARFPSWLYAIATRKAVDAVRRAVKQRRTNANAAAQQEIFAAEPDPAAVAADRHDVVAALNALSIEHRIVVELFYLDDMNVAEIATAIAVPEGTVKSRLHHARRVLKHHLEGDTDEQA